MKNKHEKLLKQLEEMRENAPQPLPEITEANAQDEKIADAVEAFRKRQKRFHNEGFAGEIEDMQNEKGLFLLLTRKRFKGMHSPWLLVENPTKTRAIYSMKEILSNSSIQYVEMIQLGVIFRMIRYKNRGEYFTNEKFIPKSDKLNFNKPKNRRYK